jgi:hypothetical protein
MHIHASRATACDENGISTFSLTVREESHESELPNVRLFANACLPFDRLRVEGWLVKGLE